MGIPAHAEGVRIDADERVVRARRFDDGQKCASHRSQSTRAKATGGWALLGVSLAITAFLCGCTTTPIHVTEPLTAGKLAGNDPADRMEFWYQLASRPLVCNDEAFHALLVYQDGTDPNAGYDARVKALQGRGMLSTHFHATATDAVDRGTLAVALAKALDIRGGVTMQLFGVNPRYAVRAMEFRKLYPPSSPNQLFSGAEFVAVIGRAEDYQRGNPADAPAVLLPGEINGDAKVEDQAIVQGIGPSDIGQSGNPNASTEHPLMLNVLDLNANAWWQDAPATQNAGPKPTPDKPVKLKAIITGIEGELVEVRKTPADMWTKARVGMSISETGEFRTGPKSAIRFVIPPDQVYTLDRQGTCSLLQAMYDGKKVECDVGMSRGRVRLDVAPIAKSLPKSGDPNDQPYRIEEAGIEHGVMIRSPSAALAVRGTVVSLYDEAGFAPEAVSLEGRAQFRNIRRQLVAFGGKSAGKTLVRADQTSSAQQALTAATALPNSEVSRIDFDIQQTHLLIARGGFQRGDVLTGNSRVTDAELVPTLPGSLNFVLRWDGGPERKLNDLNLFVVSPANTATEPDFVGNPPFILSLNPGDPTAEAIRSKSYPRNSRTGGQISKNHVGPEGLEFASWPTNYPVGTYRVVVFDLLDANPPPAETVNPVNYTLDVFLNKRVLINTVSGTVGELQTSRAVAVPVPSSAVTSARSLVAATSTETPRELRVPAGPGVAKGTVDPVHKPQSTESRAARAVARTP